MAEITRRDLLKTIGAGAVTVGSSVLLADLTGTANALDLSTVNFNVSQGRNIVIIGGGAAGLNAQYQLEKHGIHAELYEGNKNRLGGRMFTMRAPDGSTFDAGGQLINADQKLTLALARELSVGTKGTYRSPDQNAPITSIIIDGTRYTEQEYISAVQPLVKQILKDRAKLSSQQGTAHAKLLDGTSLKAFVDKVPLPSWAKVAFDLYISQELGRDPKDQSALGFVQDMGFERLRGAGQSLYEEGYGKYIIDGGSSQLINALSAAIKSDIHLDYRLTRIEQGAQKYTLSFGNGSVVRADTVILAMPLTTLRLVDLSRSGFSKDQIQAITKTQYGTSEKLVIGFHQDPRQKNDRKGCETLNNELAGTMWFDNRYASPEKPYNLIVFRGGAAGLRTTKAHIAGEARRLLDAVDARYDGASEYHNGFMYVTNWNDPQGLSCGGYACPGVGQGNLVVTTKDGGVYFSGEHMKHEGRSSSTGYIDSAVQSGNYVVGDYLKYHNLPPRKLTSPG